MRCRKRLVDGARQIGAHNADSMKWLAAPNPSASTSPGRIASGGPPAAWLRARAPGRADRAEQAILLPLLTAAAFLIRLVVLATTVEVTADNQVRALMADYWARAPHIPGPSVWPPGYMILAGLFRLLFEDPFLSSRILNLILGTLTVPVLYLLVRRLYGSGAAFFSAALLAVLPLHVGLSATSLSETSFIFFTLAGVWLLFRSVAAGRRAILPWALSLVCLSLAGMIRYEAWLLVPVLPAYYLAATRRPGPALAMLGLLGILPALWLLRLHLAAGDAMLGFTAARIGVEKVGASGLGPYGTLHVIGLESVANLGWFLALAAPLGVAWELWQACRGRLHLERLTFLVIVCMQWAFMFHFALGRGESLWPRYLLMSFVLALPFAVVPLAGWLPRQPWRAFALLGVALVSLGSAYLARRPPIYVTREEPRSIQQLADWIRSGPYRDASILLTLMRWDAIYLPVYLPGTGMELRPAYFPEHVPKSRRYAFVVSRWAEDEWIRAFVEEHEPALFVTRAGDEEFQARAEAALGRAIAAEDLVYSVEDIRVYRLAPMR
jgi:hypothetical protein